MMSWSHTLPSDGPADPSCRAALGFDFIEITMVLSDPDEIDAAWIDAALQRAGLIQPGAVAAIDVRPGSDRPWSRITRVGVRYREGVPDTLPRQLQVKICGADGGVFGRSEVDYYRRDHVAALDAPLPKCFDAAYADAPRRYHLLLKDLSETHVNGDEVTPMTGSAAPSPTRWPPCTPIAGGPSACSNLGWTCRDARTSIAMSRMSSRASSRCWRGPATTWHRIGRHGFGQCSLVLPKTSRHAPRIRAP